MLHFISNAKVNISGGKTQVSVMEKENFMLACLFIPYILTENGSYASFTSLCSLQLQHFSKIYVS